MSRKSRLILLGLGVVGGSVAVYCAAEKRRQMCTVPLDSHTTSDADDAHTVGSVHLTAGTIEKMLYQCLEEMRYVRPRRVRVRFTSDRLTAVSCAFAIERSRFAPEPLEIERRLRQNLAAWTMIDPEPIAWHLEVTA